MKFLKKKGVKIGAIVAAVAVLLLLIYFCVRPVSVGMTYSNTETTKNLLGKEVTTTTKVAFNSFNKMTTTTIVDGKETSKIVSWYFEKDGIVVNCGLAEGVLAISEDAYKEIRQTYLDNWNSEDVKDELKSSAFKYGDATCGGAIAVVSVLAVIELALAAVIVLSFMAPAKKKGKRK